MFLYALRNGLDLPIGTQDSDVLDSRFNDEDDVGATATLFDLDEDQDESEEEEESANHIEATAWTVEALEARATEIYGEYESTYKRRFRWLRSDLFLKSLESDLQSDSDSLLSILQDYGDWFLKTTQN